MDIQATKIELAQMLLSETRESVLQEIRLLLSKSDEIVAYTTAGEPLTKSDYDGSLEEAEHEIKAGRVIDHEELKKKVKTWG